MAGSFNPYREWLGLATQEPNYYQLLGVPEFEPNPETLWAAAYQRRAILRAQQYGEHAELAKRLLDEVDAAEACLLNPGRKTDYDKALRRGELVAGKPKEEPASEGPPWSAARRSERLLKPGGKEPRASEPGPTPSSGRDSGGRQETAKPGKPDESLPPLREPLPPIDTGEPPQPNKPKAAWGYDDGVPFRRELSQAPMAAPAPGAAPLRPQDFAQQPASPGSFGPAAPMAGIPGQPGIQGQPPPNWSPGPTSAPMAGIPAPQAATPYYSSAPSAMPASVMVPGEFMGQPPSAAQVPPGYAPMASPVPGGAAPMAGVPIAGIPTATPMAAPVRHRKGDEADDPFAAAGDTGIGPGHFPSGRRPRLVRRTSSAVYFFGGLLLIVGLAAAAIVVVNYRPRENGLVVDDPPNKSSHKTIEPIKTQVIPPTKTIDTKTVDVISVDPPVKTELPKNPPAKTEMPSDPPSKEVKKAANETPDPARDKFVDAALLTARYYLAERELEKAKQHIALAKKHAAGAHQAQIARVDSLAHYVTEFWRAVRDYCNRLEGAAALTIQGITIGFVEATDDYVIFRRAGRNERHYYFPSSDGPLMKTGLAVGLAELHLAKDDAVTHLILGAFHTVNPTSERDVARGHFAAAQTAGNEDIKRTVAMLMPELEVAIPKEQPKLPSPPGGAVQPTEAGKPAAPTGDVLAKAQEAMRAKYKQDLAAAVFEADKAALAEKLREAAGDGDLDAVGRYALLVEARDLAAAGRKPALALEIVAAIDKQFTIDALAMKIDVLAAAQKAAEDDAATNKAVAEAALALADEAALLEKNMEAYRLAAIALQTARKAKDAELLKQATAREKEIRALRPAKS